MHHEVFLKFKCWQGDVAEGFSVNFLGVKTRISYFPQEFQYEPKHDRWVSTTYPSFNEQYFEWIDLLEAVVTAKQRFVMIELGAGWGRWITNAAAALRQSSNLPYTLIAVEAEPTHFKWISEHLQENNIDLSACQLIQAAAHKMDGKVGFHIGEPNTWYGQAIGGPMQVDSISLTTLLERLDRVDLIDFDVQGTEFIILEAGLIALDEKVRRVHIGTHSKEIESALRDLFRQMGWVNIRDYPCNEVTETDWGTIYFQDGVQSWINPKFFTPEQLRELSSCRVPTVLGFTLELPREDRITKVLRKDGIFETPETELVRRLVRPGDICIDAGCQFGYYTSLLSQLVGKKGRVYAFDANPQCCETTLQNLALNALSSAEVVNAIFSNRDETASIHTPRCNQEILTPSYPTLAVKNTVTVHQRRLEEFLSERRVEHVRLLRLDVGGFEELVLKGLGRFLINHLIDFILVKLSDFTLQRENTCTEKIAAILKDAGFTPFKYNLQNPSGWSQAAHVQSRDDRNYLFASPAVHETISTSATIRALLEIQRQRDQWERERAQLLREVVQLRSDLAGYSAQTAQLQADLEKMKRELNEIQANRDQLRRELNFLTDSLQEANQRLARVLQEKAELEAVWQAAQKTAGWHMLTRWRKLRDVIAPAGSRRRKLYDLIVGPLRG